MIPEKTFSRRTAFKLTGGGLLGGFLAGGKAKAPPSFVPGEAADAPVAQNGWQLLSKLRSRLTWDNYKVPSKNAGHLDPDIACLRSVSPVMRAWMQRERDYHSADWRDALEKKLTGS